MHQFWSLCVGRFHVEHACETYGEACALHAVGRSASWHYVGELASVDALFLRFLSQHYWMDVNCLLQRLVRPPAI